MKKQNFKLKHLIVSFLAGALAIGVIWLAIEKTSSKNTPNQVSDILLSAGLEAEISEIEIVGTRPEGGLFGGITQAQQQDAWETRDCERLLTTVTYPTAGIPHAPDGTWCEVFYSTGTAAYVLVGRKDEEYGPYLGANIYVYTENSATAYRIQSGLLDDVTERLQQEVGEPPSNVSIGSPQYRAWFNEFSSLLDAYIHESPEELNELKTTLTEAAQAIVSSSSSLQ